MTADVRAVLEPTYPGRSIADVRTRPYPYATSFRLDEVTVDFDDGRRDVLILKDFDRARMLPDARQHRPVLADHDHREIETYRRVLAPAGIGPRCQAAVVDATMPRYWLVTERVRGVELWQIGDIAVWECVVRWIAQLHATFSGRREFLAGHPHLPVLDAAWFDDWTFRALARLSTSTDPRAEALGRALQGIDFAGEFAALPTTFVHGEFYPSNVMIGTDDCETRVYPIDWENAAIGPAMVDLAAIASGWDEVTEARLVRAYGLDGCAERALLLCRLHLAIRWISWPERWIPPREHRQDWIGTALELVVRLR
jgi:aminoglycoside phosphotransferase (APT) family kinase protein